jgi:hypothetical protein
MHNKLCEGGAEARRFLHGATIFIAADRFYHRCANQNTTE